VPETYPKIFTALDASEIQMDEARLSQRLGKIQDLICLLPHFVGMNA
jgi:hypothetical protein